MNGMFNNYCKAIKS